MNCAYHSDREPVGACVACGKLICVECKTEISGKIYCNPCVEKMFSESKPAAPATAAATAASATTAAAAATKASPKPKKEEPPVTSAATDTTPVSRPAESYPKTQRKWIKWVVGIVITIIILLVAIWAVLSFALNYDVKFSF
jgi:uncharacterized integral membrane protein